MKKLLVILPIMFGLILVVPHASAQDATSGMQAPTPTTKSSKGTKGSHAKKSSGRSATELADLTTKLSLTDDQQAKIKPILDDEGAKIHAAKESSTGSADDEKAKTKVIRDDAHAQIRALLTPDQQTTYDGMSKKGHHKKADAPTT